MSTVYVVQESPGKDISSAEEYGDFHVLLFPRDLRKSTDHMVDVLYAELKDFTADDYLLLIGSPVAIGLAAAVACDISGGYINVLEWDRRKRSYKEREVNIWNK